MICEKQIRIFYHFFKPGPPGGGVSHWHGIRICACLLGRFFGKFGIAIGGFSSEMKEPKLHKLGVFWAKYCKSTQFGQNWVLFFRKWYIDGWEIRQKIGIEIVRFSRSGRHIHVRFWWKYPPPPGTRAQSYFFLLFFLQMLYFNVLNLQRWETKTYTLHARVDVMRHMPFAAAINSMGCRPGMTQS